MGQPIDKITLRGFKSIKDLEDFPLRSLNILIGANGAGKSNFVSFFTFMREAEDQKLFAERPIAIEQAILADVSAELGTGFNRDRFIPYVQMHEFEALLFSDPKRLADGLELPDDAAVRAIRDQFHRPEEINDNHQTAPSTRSWD